MARVAMYLQDKHEIREGMAYAQYAEQRGFEAIWQAESRLVRDAIVPMAAFAAVTSRINIGGGVLNNWTRNIGLLAATFLTLDDLAPNRIICGIGAWWDPLARQVGIERRKPLKAMRETIEVMKRLLDMERVTFHGEFHHVEGIELDAFHVLELDRKSTRLNSSHSQISYAVFCLKKKNIEVALREEYENSPGSHNEAIVGARRLFDGARECSSRGADSPDPHIHQATRIFTLHRVH